MGLPRPLSIHIMNASTQFLSLFSEDSDALTKLNAAYRKRAENLAYAKQMGQISPEEFSSQSSENEAAYKRQVAQLRAGG